MPDYSKAKIYKIYCNITGETYYGSTCNTLTKRISDHKCGLYRWKDGKTNYIKSYDIIERDDYDYSLVEYFPCDSKEELHARERYYIENNDCVNKVVPGRKRVERIGQWREQNRTKIRENDRRFYQQNKTKILERHKEKVQCGCGSEFRKDSLSRHIKTKKHLAWIESQE